MFQIIGLDQTLQYRRYTYESNFFSPISNFLFALVRYWIGWPLPKEIFAKS